MRIDDAGSPALWAVHFEGVGVAVLFAVLSATFKVSRITPSAKDG